MASAATFGPGDSRLRRAEALRHLGLRQLSTGAGSDQTSAAIFGFGCRVFLPEPRIGHPPSLEISQLGRDSHPSPVELLALLRIRNGIRCLLQPIARSLDRTPRCFLRLLNEHMQHNHTPRALPSYRNHEQCRRRPSSQLPELSLEVLDMGLAHILEPDVPESFPSVGTSARSEAGRASIQRRPSYRFPAVIAPMLYSISAIPARSSLPMAHIRFRNIERPSWATWIDSSRMESSTAAVEALELRRRQQLVSRGTQARARSIGTSMS
mgnify:CR=1 FL=1